MGGVTGREDLGLGFGNKPMRVVAMSKTAPNTDYIEYVYENDEGGCVKYRGFGEFSYHHNVGVQSGQLLDVPCP